MAKTEEQNAALEGKLKALQATMSKIEKDFGKGAIMKLGDEQVDNVEVIPTGSIGLDAALGVVFYLIVIIIFLIIISRHPLFRVRSSASSRVFPA